MFRFYYYYNYYYFFLEFRETVLDTEFEQGNNFFKMMLNNFEFLMVYYDNLILFEDFEKLPGDEEIVKKHDNLRTLLKRK